MVQLHFDFLEVVMMVIATSEFVGKFPRCSSVNLISVICAFLHLKRRHCQQMIQRWLLLFRPLKMDGRMSGRVKKWSVHSMCDKIIYCMLVTSCYFTVYLMISLFTSIYNIYYIIIYRYNYLYGY